jgi:hypothetical protein
LNRERAIMDNWYPVRLAPRDGTPVILWIEDQEAPPSYPVTVGAWEHDDITGRSHWRVLGPAQDLCLIERLGRTDWEPLRCDLKPDPQC